MTDTDEERRPRRRAIAIALAVALLGGGITTGVLLLASKGEQATTEKNEAAATATSAANQAAAGQALADQVAKACTDGSLTADVAAKLCPKADAVASASVPPVPGKSGKDGVDGTNGRDVSSVVCLPSGEWLITYSDGTTSNGGTGCVAKDGRTVAMEPTERPVRLCRVYMRAPMASISAGSSCPPMGACRSTALRSRCPLPRRFRARPARCLRRATLRAGACSSRSHRLSSSAGHRRSDRMRDRFCMLS